MNYRYTFFFEGTVIAKVESVQILATRQVDSILRAIGADYVNDISYIFYTVTSLNGAQVVKING